MTNNIDTVFVGLSGGVDSSVAALRLKQQGYKVVGVFIKVWQPDFIDCNWEKERLDAMRVAAHLEIPFLTCDAETAYKQEVADYFVAEYQAGRTPNPDVMCNKAVKFGAFLRFARAHGADYVATGHYAQKLKDNGSDSLHYKICRGVDQNKDQTYFLWTLTQAQLAKVLFPVGDTPKDKIRHEAMSAGIPVATKKDSQGICFLGHIDIPEFLSHFVDLKPGAVLDQQNNVIGTHQGALVYTHGQRHGFTITEVNQVRAPHYVIAKDLDKNTLTVSSDKPLRKVNTDLKLVELNIINSKIDVGTKLTAQTRYRQTPFSVTVHEVADTTITLTPQQNHEIVSPGQSCVLYDGLECLGGGIIAE